MSQYVHCYELFTIRNGMFCDWSLNMFAATHYCRDVGIQMLKLFHKFDLGVTLWRRGRSLLSRF